MRNEALFVGAQGHILTIAYGVHSISIVGAGLAPALVNLKPAVLQTRATASVATTFFYALKKNLKIGNEAVYVGAQGLTSTTSNVI